jgi:hypothetical protein
MALDGKKLATSKLPFHAVWGFIETKTKKNFSNPARAF